MSVAFYVQDDDDEYRLVCPECGHEVLISEYGEVGLCTECGEEYPISELPCSVITSEKRSEI